MPNIEWDPARIIDPTALTGLTDDDFRAPDMVGVCEGWRAWTVDREAPLYGTAPKLFSATYQYFWAPRQKARALCPRDDTHVPGEDCSCGFYAAKTLPELRKMGYHSYDENGDTVTVVGQLAMWGKVIEGSQGWRSEYAYPAKLFVPFEAFRLAGPLLRAYGVPVELLNILDPKAIPGKGRQVKGNRARPKPDDPMAS